MKNRWASRLTEELNEDFKRKNKEMIETFITDYEEKMADLGYATLESWKMLRDELDIRLDEGLKRMLGGINK